MTTNPQIHLVSRPSGEASVDNFKLIEVEVRREQHAQPPADPRKLTLQHGLDRDRNFGLTRDRASYNDRACNGNQ